MKKNRSLILFLRPLSLLSALLLANAAQAEWSISISAPLQTQYHSTSSTTIYGAPGSRITSTRQVPQTICRSVWAGSTTQQCSTQYVTVEENYVPPNIVYVDRPIYVAPNAAFGYPSYNNGYRQHQYQHQHQPQYSPPGPPPTTVYNSNGATYGIGGGVPTYGGYGNQSNSSITIRLNNR